MHPSSKTLSEILAATAHRPWPLPQRPWMMFQTWNDLLFAHWALPPEQIRPLVPPELDLDLFDGKAWVAITPFWMSHVHLRGMPPFPGMGTFPEMNCRTYVRYTQPEKISSPDRDNQNAGSRPGVFFFSLDAASVPAVLGARLTFGLPYYWARMTVKHLPGDQIEYASIRRLKPRPADVTVRYRPAGPIRQHEQKTALEIFLTERYCLYVVRRKHLFRAEIQHLPWPLQRAQAEFHKNTLADRAGIALTEKPDALHFSRRLDVLIYSPEQIS